MAVPARHLLSPHRLPVRPVGELSFEAGDVEPELARQRNELIASEAGFRLEQAVVHLPELPRAAAASAASAAGSASGKDDYAGWP